MLGLNSQLVEVDSNRRLSRIVRNLASPNIVVIVLWNVMVRINMELLHLLWLLLYALKRYTTCLAQDSYNLEMDSYN